MRPRTTLAVAQELPVHARGLWFLEAAGQLLEQLLAVDDEPNPLQ
jgi:hypothetical protein